MPDEDVKLLRRTIAFLERENAAPRGPVKDREILPESISASRSWWVPQVHRALLARLIDEPIQQLARHVFRGRLRTLAQRILRSWVASRASADWGSAVPEGAIRCDTGYVNVVTFAFFDRNGNNMRPGGAERYLIDLTALLRRWGYEPRVFQPGNFRWRRVYGDLHIESLAAEDDPQRFAECFRQQAPAADLTIYHAFFLASPGAPPTSIGISHGNYWDNPYIQAFQLHFREKLREVESAIRNVHDLVCVDTNTINWLRASHYRLAAKAIYVPNYVDLDQFRPAPRASGAGLVVLYPRRLSTPRGFHLVHGVVEPVLAQHPSVVFHFVGKADPEEEQIVARLVALHPGHVTWYHLPPEEMPRAYAEADVVLIPTVTSEGTSLSCLEAMAAGKAVIATDVGGLPNLIIDGHNGLLIAPREAELARAIERVVTDEGLRTRLGREARRTVEDSFSKTRWEARWEELLARHLPRRPSAASSAPLTLVYPLTPGVRWSEMKQRPHHLCEGLARAGVQVFFYSDGAESARSLHDGRLQILLATDDLRPGRSIFYLHFPYNLDLVATHPAALVWYDILDDLQIFAAADRQHPPEPQALHYHARLLETAHVVTCTARRLYERYHPLRPDILYVPNGVTPSDFTGQGGRPTIPADLRRVLGRKPVIGYYGAYGEWFDFDLVNQVTETCQDYTFVFIGPDYQENLQRRLARRPNVVYLGAKPYAQLAAYLCAFDVGIIPFLVNDVTHATSPLKLFEYLAAGKPVVTTELEECRQYSGVLASKAAGEFVTNLEVALARGQDREFVAGLRREAERNSWEERIKTVLPALLRASGQQGLPSLAPRAP